MVVAGLGEGRSMSRWLLGAPALVVAGMLVLSAPGSGQRVPLRSGLVRVEVQSCGAKLVGTGFLVDRRHVVTAEHVVAGAGRIVLRRDGRVVGAGTLAGADGGLDVALIRSDRTLPGHVFSLAGRPARVGERVSALGFRSTVPGRVRGFARMVSARGGRSGQPLIQTDASVRPGDSGGPVVGRRGDSVIGLVDLSSVDRGGPSFAVGARSVAPLVARWRRDPEAVPQQRCAVALR
jgi:putative serine protease PepD